jgi:dCTP deaminase
MNRQTQETIAEDTRRGVEARATRHHMSILTRGEILQEVAAGNIGVDPWDDKMVGPASIDLHLGRSFRVFKATRTHVRVCLDADYRDLSIKVDVPEGESLLLMPGETLLGITLERVRLAPHICG